MSNSMSFMGKLQKQSDLKYNMSITENGAVGYKTTGSKLVDMNFKVSSYRNKSDAEIVNDFRSVYAENPVNAIKWLFYVRDVREGQGERRLFRTVIMDMTMFGDISIINAIIPFIPEYGRWDDLWTILETNINVRDRIISMVKDQLNSDLKNAKEGKSVSLLAKWMPSENTSSKVTKHYADVIRSGLHITPRNYRKILSYLRNYIDVTEVKMSGNNWSEIKYENVPSRANLIYKDAFMKHDSIRRREYLQSLQNGETKINASVLYPHDILHKCIQHYDDTVEQLWKNLPDLVNGNESTIVVADGSGSMTSRVGNTQISALEVANSLAIYFSERCHGEFKDKYITFSERPRIVDFSKASRLVEKWVIAKNYCEVANTNIEAVFDLILDTAIRNEMRQEDIPSNVLIISDMEFDACVCDSSRSRYSGRFRSTLFDEITKKYESHGYKLPKLIFWNVCRRTNTIPIKENENGVILVSGFSVNTMKLVMSGKTNPYDALMDILNSDRYKPIGDKIYPIIYKK